MATVMVAGMFAFMPVEQASTVHTTIQGSQSQVQAAEDTNARVAAANNDVAIATISTNNNTPFLITDMIVCTTSGTDTDQGGAGGNNEVVVNAITIDGDVVNVGGEPLADGILLADNEVDSACNDALAALQATNLGEFSGTIGSNGQDVVVTFSLDGTGDDTIDSVKIIGIVDGSSTLSVVTSLP